MRHEKEIEILKNFYFSLPYLVLFFILHCNYNSEIADNIL